MRKLLSGILVFFCMILPVHGLDLSAPEVPDSGAVLMPEATQSFGDGLMQILKDVLPLIRPDLAEAAGVSSALLAAVLMIAVLQSISEKTQKIADLAGVVTIAALMLRSTHSMIQLGAQTIQELSEYEKLLLPVLTAAIAAQGGPGTAAALYGGTALFNAFLSDLICKILLPMIYMYLAFATAGACMGEDSLTKMKETTKNTLHWTLRTLITAFTAYLGITGVVSGTTDAAALKITKTTIATLVPVVGGILSDASEAVLVSAALVKNSVGIYGIYAILAVFLGPFVKIGVHYLVLKYTGAVSDVVGTKQMSGMIHDFSNAMGLLLACTGTMCLLLLISCICFLKGVG